MARTAKIHYQRVTFSFPKEVAEKLREKVPNNEMSSYVAKLIKDDLGQQTDDAQEYIQALRDFRENVLVRDTRSSLEILREMRYHGKH